MSDFSNHFNHFVGTPNQALPPDFGAWFACSEAERPTDPYVVWHYWDCAGCRLKARALKLQFPDDTHVAWLNDFMDRGAA